MRRGTALVVALLAALAAGCGGTPSPGPSASEVALRGLPPPRPYRLPAVTLADQEGRPYDVRARTSGRDVIVYFGYTHCPDACPTAMADLAAAMRSLPPQVVQHETVLFVTSDPARDTPAVLKKWLPSFGWPAGASVIGLTGDDRTLSAAGRALDVPLVPATGSGEVAHGTQLLGFDAAGLGKVIWLPDNPPADLAHDLPLLDRAPAPSPVPAAFVPARQAGDLLIGNTVVRQSAGRSTLSFTVRNAGGRPDALQSVTSPAGTVDVPAQEVPAHRDLQVSQAALQLRQQPAPGDVLVVTLHFVHQGTVAVQVPVTSLGG